MIDAPKKPEFQPGMNGMEDNRFKVDNYMPKDVGVFWDFVLGDNKSLPM
jgi:hypothetical protein